MIISYIIVGVSPKTPKEDWKRVRVFIPCNPQYLAYCDNNEDSINRTLVKLKLRMKEDQTWHNIRCFGYVKETVSCLPFNVECKQIINVNFPKGKENKFIVYEEEIFKVNDLTNENNYGIGAEYSEKYHGAVCSYLKQEKDFDSLFSEIWDTEIRPTYMAEAIITELLASQCVDLTLPTYAQKPFTKIKSLLSEIEKVYVSDKAKDYRKYLAIWAEILEDRFQECPNEVSFFQDFRNEICDGYSYPNGNSPYFLID